MDSCCIGHPLLDSLVVCLVSRDTGVEVALCVCVGGGGGGGAAAPAY